MNVALAKTVLSFLFEDKTNIDAGLFLYFEIGIVKLHTQFLAESPPDRGLSGAHRADQKHTGIHGLGNCEKRYRTSLTAYEAVRLLVRRGSACAAQPPMATRPPIITLAPRENQIVSQKPCQH